MNQAYKEEVSLLTSLECLIHSSQADGITVGHFEDLKDMQLIEFLSVEGLDVKATFKKISEWIAKFVAKISVYLRTTLANLSASNNLDKETVKALRGALSKITDGSKLSENQKGYVRDNRALLVSALLFNIKPALDIIGGEFNVTLDEVNAILEALSIKPIKIRIEKDDILTGVTISSAKGNVLSIAYVTSLLKRGTVEVDCGIVKKESKSYKAINNLPILRGERVRELYDTLSDLANSQTEELYKTAPNTLERDDIDRIKNMIGFVLSIVVKQIALIKNTNEFVIKLAKMEASKN